MLLSPRPTSITGNLLRLVALWLGLVLLVQVLTVAMVQAAGPLHHHQGAGDASVMVHRHDHDEGQRHHHAAAEPGVMSDSDAAALDDALSAAAAALAAAMALLATVQTLRFAGGLRPVLRPAFAWAVLTAAPGPLLKPPRAAE